MQVCVTGRRRRGTLSITFRVDLATSADLFVCVSMRISAIKKASDTKFGMKVPICLKQQIFIYNQ